MKYWKEIFVAILVAGVSYPIFEYNLRKTHTIKIDKPVIKPVIFDNNCSATADDLGDYYDPDTDTCYVDWEIWCNQTMADDNCDLCVKVYIYKNDGNEYNLIYTECFDIDPLNCNTEYPDYQNRISNIKTDYGLGHYNVVWRLFQNTCANQGDNNDGSIASALTDFTIQN